MRLKAEIWISGLLRRAQSAGAMALVAHRGDKDAGTVMVRVSTLTGCSALYVPFTGLEGDRRWRVSTGPDTPDSKVEEIIAREIQYDPDLWVVEIEDRLGAAFLDEVVDALE